MISFMFMMLSMFIQTTILIEWNIFMLSNMSIDLPIMLDYSSMIFMTTVLIITTSVMQFSKSYMIMDKTMNRFIILVILFVMSMMLLILFPHSILLLLGWDGLGITSFILVIYYNNSKSLGAGMITALTNRIGDVMLLITIALLMNQGQWLIINIWNTEIMKWTPIIIMIAAMTKSAQMPFSSWLPAAMAAPTPVSALVHSSTLVTAGVFIIYRFFPLMSSWENFNNFLMMISCMTLLMASLSAMAECDMKKIIALSTLSQVALMMFTLSMNMPEIAFFHLITHALFKALLFICAGNIIDIHHHSQDLRQMGNMSQQLPSLSTAMIIANMALCGSPFLAGFYSKDLIIESMNMMVSKKNIMIMCMFCMATMMTTAYSTRFIIYTSMSPTMSSVSQYSTENMTQIKSILFLSMSAVIGGALINWLMVSPMIQPLFYSPMKMMIPMMVFMGILWGTKSSFMKTPLPISILTSHCHMWFLSPISSHIMPNIMMKTPLMAMKLTDQGWSKMPFNIMSLMLSNSSNVMKLQNNSIMINTFSNFMLFTWIMYNF
uniref:NADH-ubiquinone oxidoreductase chain 5 n=1 Tax=Laeonereis culveri TaxID=1859080 RepID=A0A1B0ZF03_9ANNE|nr:NADH dehydrogenase subunti 5 [Laeonereis culveri]